MYTKRPNKISRANVRVLGRGTHFYLILVPTAMITIPLRRDLYLGHEFSGGGARAHLLVVLNPLVSRSAPTRTVASLGCLGQPRKRARIILRNSCGASGALLL